MRYDEAVLPPSDAKKSEALSARAHPLSWVFFSLFCLVLLWSCRAFFDYGAWLSQLRGKNWAERGRLGANEWQCFLARSGRVELQKNFAKAHRELAQISRDETQWAHLLFFKDLVIIVNPDTHSPSKILEPITIVRSIRVLPQEILSKGIPRLMHSEKEFPSGVANAWAWIVQQDAQLPPDAKIFLNEPDLALYYFGTSIWYPRRLDVDTRATQIRDYETFVQEFKNRPPQLGANSSALFEKELRGLGYTHRVTRKNGALRLLNIQTAHGGGPH